MSNSWDQGYDGLGQLTSAQGQESGGAARLHEQLVYGYDAAGNLKSRTQNGLVLSFSIDNVLNAPSAVSRSRSLTVATAGKAAGAEPILIVGAIAGG